MTQTQETPIVALNTCPKCGGHNISWEQTDFIDSGTRQTANCEDCKTEWVEYCNSVLAGIEYKGEYIEAPQDTIKAELLAAIRLIIPTIRLDIGKDGCMIGEPDETGFAIERGTTVDNPQPDEAAAALWLKLKGAA